MERIKISNIINYTSVSGPGGQGVQAAMMLAHIKRMQKKYYNVPIITF